MGLQDCTSRLDLHIQCRQLRGRDGIFGKSDPFCVLSEQRNGTWVELGRTEVAVNQHDVDFVKSFIVNYNFELRQPLQVKVFDMDEAAKSAESVSLGKQDYLGAVEFELAALARDPSKSLTRSLAGAAAVQGTVTVQAEEVVNFKKEMRLTVKGHGLANMDGWGGKSDPFLRVCKCRESAQGEVWQPVLQSGVKDNDLNPVWTDLEVSLGRFCGGDFTSLMLWQVMDFDKDGTHDLIGQVKASVNDVIALASNNNTLDLENPKRKKSPGKISFSNLTITDRHSFLDYIRSGTAIDFHVAIDFTASNGDPRAPNSLHYGAQTQYELAITGVASILDAYNTERLYTAWAFGARVGGGVTNHCYPLNGNFQQPQVEGSAGILSAYRGMLANSSLSGPTNFSPVIQATMAATRARPSRYTCLLILTDGEISDMDATLASIVEASHLPMSILIVGIGQSPFTSMNVLDCDGGRLKDGAGRVALRDIVQFVPFSQFAGNGNALASQVLAELPGQVVDHMRRHNIVPGAAAASPAPLI